MLADFIQHRHPRCRGVKGKRVELSDIGPDIRQSGKSQDKQSSNKNPCIDRDNVKDLRNSKSSDVRC